ncbi:hypothetical protein WN943_017801 [Citrus x changshan-huyou]
MALTTTSCTDELAAVQSARAAALQARNWARASIAPNGLETCLEGLEEKGRAQTLARAHNLTVLLGEALNLHARGRGFRKGKKL